MRPSRHPVARLPLARLVALLLLVQWAGAVLPHARAMAALGGAMAVELCTPAGMRTVLVGEDGKPVPAAQEGDCCDLCQGPAAITAAGPEAPVRRVAYAAAPPAPGRAGWPPFPPRAPPQQPRAPPQA